MGMPLHIVAPAHVTSVDLLYLTELLSWPHTCRLCCLTLPLPWYNRCCNDFACLSICLDVKLPCDPTQQVACSAHKDHLAWQVLSGLAAGLVTLTAFGASADVELQDERAVRQRGFDLIYEARDLDLGQNERDGLTQYRKNLDSTRSRVKKSEDIIDSKLEGLIKKKYW